MTLIFAVLCVTNDKPYTLLYKGQFIYIYQYNATQAQPGGARAPQKGGKNWGGGKFPGKGLSAQRAPPGRAIKEFNFLRDLDSGSG